MGLFWPVSLTLAVFFTLNRKLRCSVYLCIERLVQLTRSLPEGGGVVAKLVQQMLDDIKPMAPQTKVMIWKGVKGL